MKHLLFFLLPFLFISCSSEKKVDRNQEVSNTELNSTSATKKYTIQNTNSEISPITIDLSDATIKFVYDNQNYTSKLDGDKRKYYLNGNMVYEVKYKEDAFKLRDTSSNLRWKVKLYDSKIKISDNEENLNGFEIKRDDKTIKIQAESKTIIRFEYTDQLELTFPYKNGMATVKSDIPSLSFPCLSLTSIPELERVIITAELIAKDI